MCSASACSPGLTYGLLAAGLVLVFRSSRFINFAHGAIGVFGAAVCSLAVRDFEVPYWFAFMLGIAVSAGLGALTEIGIVKPLATAPKVLPMVATLGLSSFLIFTALAINPNGLSGLNFPEPAGMPTATIGALRVTPAFAAQAILSPILLVGLGLFLWRSRTGLAIRAAASNSDAASTAGVPSRSMSVLAWAIAGGVAAFSVTLIIPTKGVVTPETLGPELLIRGLAAAAIARFTNYGIAVGVATLIGVVEQVFATNPEAKGLIELVVLAAVIIALLTSSSGLRASLENWGQRSLPRKLPVGLPPDPADPDHHAGERRRRVHRCALGPVRHQRLAGARRHDRDLPGHRRRVGGHRHRPRRTAVVGAVRLRSGRRCRVDPGVRRLRLHRRHHRRSDHRGVRQLRPGPTGAAGPRACSSAWRA